MKQIWQIPEAGTAEVCRLAERIALKISVGDMIALHGGLGTGKTFFARALIRALLDDEAAEVASPTFSLIQSYHTSRLSIAHLDLYRLTSDEDLRELGLDEIIADGTMIVEWPERLPANLSDNRLVIHFREMEDVAKRLLSIEGTGTWCRRLSRLKDISRFLDQSTHWSAASLRLLQGDASARSYARLTTGSRPALLMDAPRQPDGPAIRNGLAYSRLARLAEDVRPYVAISTTLRGAGLSAPEIFAADLDLGLLIIEDFGDRVLVDAIRKGESQPDLWRAATDVLIALRGVPTLERWDFEDGTSFQLPSLDTDVMEIETQLLLEWYWPLVHATPIDLDRHSEFVEIWQPILAVLAQLPAGWMLRDFHSPNLLWLPERHGSARTGLIDFQDALKGPPAYDLVSLLQDARVDVSAELERTLLQQYCSAAAAEHRNFDRGAFEFAYAAFGAQRNTKILGIFARLAMRDGKPRYLDHIPRIWGYLDRNLTHPELSALRTWYDRNFGAARQSNAVAPRLSIGH